MAAVQATRPPRDAADEPLRRQMTQNPAVDRLPREGLAGPTVAAWTAGTPQASRALAAYADVAGEGDHGDLRELLGFDAYA